MQLLGVVFALVELAWVAWLVRQIREIRRRSRAVMAERERGRGGFSDGH